jgi:hypothetical protein
MPRGESETGAKEKPGKTAFSKGVKCYFVNRAVGKRTTDLRHGVFSLFDQRIRARKIITFYSLLGLHRLRE